MSQAATAAAADDDDMGLPPQLFLRDTMRDSIGPTIVLQQQQPLT